ncbi:MAG: hypothetical protein JO013_02305 [Alphaproteobacteria bacterium]|nr:hypothetical protein [Alphaproteobacteria bacterium]
MWKPPLLALLLLSPAPPAGGGGRDALMDEIERKVVLPDGARPLRDYGRNYALAGRGIVRGTYLLPLPPRDPASGCAVMLPDLTSRPCTRKEVRQSVAAEAALTAAQTRAGTRRWFDDPRRLPRIFDGGCAQVTVEYDVAAHHVLAVACNGDA